MTVFFAHPRGGWGIVLTNSMSEKKGTTTATTDEVSAKAKKTNRKDTTKESATASTSNENIMLAVLKSIQENQNALVQRMDSMESQLNDYGYQDELEGYDANQEVAPMEMELSELDSKAEGQSRFACLSKKFKPEDVIDLNIDNVLATTTTNLYRQGMDEKLYENAVKDENCPRPGNAEGLQVAKVNKLVWDLIPAHSRSTDLKMQNISTSLVKAGCVLVKTMGKLASLEDSLKEKNLEEEINLSQIMDSLNDVLGLSGQANYQANMMRRDLLRPELKKEYSHLCNHSQPVTKWLFGDDVSKTAKEIEEFAKIGQRMSGQHHMRGGYRSRPGFRGRYRPYPLPGRGRGYGMPTQTQAYSRQNMDSKNLPRRGGARGAHRM